VSPPVNPEGLAICSQEFEVYVHLQNIPNFSRSISMTVFSGQVFMSVLTILQKGVCTHKTHKGSPDTHNEICFQHFNDFVVFPPALCELKLKGLEHLMLRFLL
jgi:hypothetical protein